MLKRLNVSHNLPVRLNHPSLALLPSGQEVLSLPVSKPTPDLLNVGAKKLLMKGKDGFVAVIGGC